MQCPHLSDASLHGVQKYVRCKPARQDTNPNRMFDFEGMERPANGQNHLDDMCAYAVDNVPHKRSVGMFVTAGLLADRLVTSGTVTDKGLKRVPTQSSFGTAVAALRRRRQSRH